MTNRSMIAIAGVIAALGMRAGAEEKLGYDPVLAEIGAPLFVNDCAACHGREGRGDGPAREALVKKPADLTAIAARRGGQFPTGEIARYIDGRFDLPAHGSREMPVWGQHYGAEASDAEIGESIARGNIASLIEHLKSIQRPPLAPRKGEPSR